jgi:hypothetical protein
MDTLNDVCMKMAKSLTPPNTGATFRAISGDWSGIEFDTDTGSIP